MKLNYNELHLKTKRTLTNDFFKHNNITYENIDETILYNLNNILSKPLTDDRRRALYEMVISKTCLEPDLELRFEKFLNTPLQTPEFFRLKFGDDEGTRRYESSCINRGRGNTLEGQIEKYGFDEGTRRHKEMNEKKVHSLENFIRKHGEEKGREMFEKTMAKKGQSLEKFINIYGETEGEMRYNDWKESCISTEKNFIKRHGEKLGKEKWLEFKENSKSTKENFIRRHGTEEGLRKWNNYKENYGWTQASKQSLEIFEPLTKFLLEKNIDFNDIFYGIENSFEFKIEHNDKLYSYDYTILPLKIIFEYNGNHVHPSKEFLGEKWDSWKHAWSGESADAKHSFDIFKNEIAEKEGFTVLVIWDFEDKKLALEKCLDLIKLKLSEMKN